MLEYFSSLTLFFELLFFVRLSTPVFFPVFLSFFFSSGHCDDSLESYDSVAHLGVELLLDGMQVVMHVLAESDSECQGLIDSFVQMVVGIKL